MDKPAKKHPKRPAAGNTVAPGAGQWHPAAAVGIALLLFLAAQFGAGIIGGLILSLTTYGGITLAEAWRQFLFILLAEGLTLWGLWILLAHKGLTFQTIGLRKPRWMDLAYTVGAFVAYFIFYGALLAVLSALIPSLDIHQKQDIGFDNVQGIIPLIPVFISLVILAPFTEEVLFRGFVFGNLRLRLGFWWSAAITSVIFGAAHLLGGEQGASLLWVAGIDTFVLSLALCYLRERTGRLWASIGLHALKNGIAFVLLFIIQGH